ncbi:alpha/beta fold hydrolase [Roseimicrobium sp. ORNL1]|uniref:alpha/beta fold hydrolase n=1 Tax=Roseimicrobium sp. ORNL1 TaxID=2711231 RepID=UPI0013E16600|nr:alpha/beta fold hydrolase [Roseimicrobium sp. ORNL1]QIF03751.1 alpha/beta fold hydrolase [Roseimicrobium sp. ORNL1]
MPTLTRPDVTLSYEVIGQGMPLVFIQGIGVAGSGWRPQMDALQDTFTCLSFDNRGLRNSTPCKGPITVEAMAEDTLALMDHLGWDSAHVIGHSMGGPTAVQLALNHPTRVRSLSLMCTFARGSDGAKLTAWVLWMTLRTRIGTRAMRRRAFLEMLYPPAYLATQDQDALARKIAPIIGRDLAVQPPILMKQLKALSRHDVYARLGELATIPTWVISGAHDRIARPDSGRSLAEAIPGAIFEVVEDASHGLPIHLVDRVNAKLRDFITHAA